VGKRLPALEDLDVNDLDTFNGKRVLITGHTGFKGAWLSIWLHSLGAKIAGYALDPPTKPSMFEAADVATCLDDHRGDVRDAAAVRGVIDRFDPEIVFHLAAQAIVRESYRDPVGTYATNIVGTAAVLQACRSAPSLRAIVVVTSDKCYEIRDSTQAHRESDRLGGFDPYSSSKACAELVSDAFRRSYFQSAGIGIATARAGNVIGGGDWAADRLVPDLARAAVTGRPALIRNPNAVRPWQHVLEPLGGYLALAAHLVLDARTFSGAWNFGPSPAAFQTVETVARLLGEHWKGRLAWTIDAGVHPHEAARLLLDSNKAATGLDWHPTLSLEDAVKLAAEWYDASRGNPAALRRLTESQIAYYAQCAAAPRHEREPSSSRMVAEK
jgi:CDP-glucose 4,6-dehydratase